MHAHHAVRAEFDASPRSAPQLCPSKYRPAIKLQPEIDVEEVAGFFAERIGRPALRRP